MQETSASLKEAAVVMAKDGELVSQHKESNFQEDTKEVILQQENCPLVSQEKKEAVLQQENCPLVSKEQEMEVNKEEAKVDSEKIKETSSSSSSLSDEEEKRSLVEVEMEISEDKVDHDQSKSETEEKKKIDEEEDELLPPPPQEDFPPPPVEMMNSVEDLPPPVFDLPSPSEDILPPPVVPEFEDKEEELEVVSVIKDDDINIKSSEDKKEPLKDVDHSPPRSSYVSLVSPTGFAPSFSKSDSEKVNETSGR